VKRLALVGASGSIGRQTLQICREHADRLDVALLAVHHNVDPLRAVLGELRPDAVCVEDPQVAGSLEVPEGTTLYSGPDAIRRAILATEFDLLVNGIVGAAGLGPSYWALDSGRDVATANKESLVIAGALLTELARKRGVSILPIDSEHSAVWQCLRAGRMEEVERVWLTASGGPFRNRPADTFDSITVEEALDHPTWKMGPKITIDSATLMNKGFEIIEARWLFDLPEEKIEVVVHPQSIIHSAVAYRDGSVMAQMGVPDMRHPIQYAIMYPHREGPAPARLDLLSLGRLDLEPPDRGRFPALDLARRALRKGPSACIVLNAANEVAVEAFLARQIGFRSICDCVAAQVDEIREEQIEDLNDIYEVDNRVRKASRSWIAQRRDSRAPQAGCTP
jgi:1-deoxy-D-xylulose-5-phosphate reductoisomerase